MWCSNAFFGATNDKTIVRAVPETKELTLTESNVVTVKGAYLIADGGFLNVGCFVDPKVLSWSLDSVRYDGVNSLSRYAKISNVSSL